MVAKVETNAQPIMWLALQGDRTQQQLNQYAVNVPKKRLETIDGVGESASAGAGTGRSGWSCVPIAWPPWGSPLRTSPTPSTRSTSRWRAASVVGQKTESLVKLDLEFHSVEALGTLVVAWKGGARSAPAIWPDLVDGLSDNRRQLARFNGESPPSAWDRQDLQYQYRRHHPDGVKDKWTRLRPSCLPACSCMSFPTTRCSSLKSSIPSKEHLLEGTIWPPLVVWIFLLSVRSTLIVALAIPVSLMGRSPSFYFAGYTLNSFTLLGLLLLIGWWWTMPSSCSENIFRHRDGTRRRPRIIGHQ